jgi:hypothetical protein
MEEKVASKPTSECKGNACGDVSITFLGPGHGYLFKNGGSRRINLRVRWSVGVACLDWSSYDLNPAESIQISNEAAYCTVEANYS